jgi:hypothetical protein
MTNKQRRKFLRLSTLMIASSALPACSGGGATSDTSRELTPSTQRDDTVSNPMRDDAVSDPILPAASTRQGLPAWLAGKAIGECIEIPGSGGAGGAAAGAWGGYAVRHDTNEIFLVAQGGHGDSYDNRVTSLNLSNDAPGWVLRNPPTPANQLVVAANYYADGKPSSRHIYDHAHWVPQVNRILQIGGRGTWPNGGDVSASDGFNPDTNEWDPPGTWTFTLGIGYGVAVDHVHGHIWTNGLRRFNPKTNTYDRAVAGSSAAQVRYPTVYDSLRDQMFCLMFGNGQGANLDQGIQASRFPTSGVGQFAVTFNASAAYTQFLAQSNPAKGYAGMTYDSDNDKFYWYSGQAGHENELYVITPPPVGNPTAAWDMSLFVFASGSASLPTTPLAGLNGRIKYLPLLKGFILCPTGTGKIYFVRTA